MGALFTLSILKRNQLLCWTVFPRVSTQAGPVQLMLKVVESKLGVLDYKKDQQEQYKNSIDALQKKKETPAV